MNSQHKKQSEAQGIIGLDKFSTVNLDEMNKASLMNRTDHKFVLNIHQLREITPQLARQFAALEIDGVVNHRYASTYFDTIGLDMYKSHHNQRLNRYKIRQRVYHSSGDSFLEIKYKNNKGYTCKSRVATDKTFERIPYNYFDFVTGKTPYHPFALQPTLSNSFYRFTLINAKRNQRITVDTNISFYDAAHQLTVENLVVLEVKSERDDMDRTIFNLMHEQGVHPGGMSKYSIGMAMVHPELKQNLFKQKIHAINKICYAV